MDQTQIRNTLLLVLAAFFWGTTFVAQSIGADYMDAFTYLACRSWLAYAFLLPVVKFMDRQAVRRGGVSGKPQTPQQRKTLVMGALCCGGVLFLSSVLQQVGIGYTTTAKAGFITTLYVLLVPIVSLFLGKRVGRKIWFCVALGLVGLYLLCMAGSFSLSRGDFLVLLCAFGFTGQILLVDHFSPQMDGVRLSCGQFLTTAVLATVAMLFFGSPTPQAIWKAMPAICYAGIFSSCVGYTLQIVGQKNLNPTIASLAMSLESVFSALAGWLVLREGMTPRELAGGALMFAAIVLAQLPDRKRVKAE